MFLLRMLVQRNLARTTQPARPVLQTEITSVCVLANLLAIIVNTVGSTLTQLFIKVVLRPKKQFSLFFGFQNYVN